MSEAADRLAQRIRAAMGDHNSDDLPVTQCVVNLRKEVVALQAQLSEARAERDELVICLENVLSRWTPVSAGDKGCAKGCRQALEEIKRQSKGEGNAN